MTLTDDHLDRALRGLATELDRQAGQVGRAAPAGRSASTSRRPSQVVGAAAVTVLVVGIGIGGLWATRARDGSTSVGTPTATPADPANTPPPGLTPTSTPMLMVPRSDDPEISLESAEAGIPGEFEEAAVLTADGRAVGLAVHHRPCAIELGPTCGGTYGTQSFMAGENVVTWANHESDLDVNSGLRTYMVFGDCFLTSVTMSALTDDVRSMLASISETESGIAVVLPDGAASLGSGPRSGQVFMSLRVGDSDGWMTQLVGGVVGAHLGTLMFGTPVATSVGGVPAWFMDDGRAFGGGWGLLAFEDHGTAVFVGLEGGTEAELRELVEHLAWVARDDVEIAPPPAVPADTTVRSCPDPVIELLVPTSGDDV